MNDRLYLLVIVFIVLVLIPVHTVDAKTLEFSVYNWKVKNFTAYKKGPGPNYWSDSEENVSVDKNGHLHLKISERNGNWYCAEVYLDRFLGYGEYIFYLDPQKTEFPDEVVLGLFL